MNNIGVDPPSDNCRSHDGCQDKLQDDDGPYLENLRAYSWTDITTDFTSAAKSLRNGELVHDSRFSLFEAMSAFELMDPKMDGYSFGGNCRRLTYEKALETGRVKLAGLPFKDLLDLMDATFSTFVSWLEGHSLAQTLFINLYLHKPLLIEERLLRVFCLSVLKLAGVCFEIISRANVHEDEDFPHAQGNFCLANGISNHRIINMLKEAEDECLKHVKNLKGRGDGDHSTKVRHHEEFLLRFRFIRNLFSSLLALTARDEKENAQNTSVSSTPPKKQNFEEAAKSLKSCEECLQKMKLTASSDITPTDPASKEFIFQHIDGFDLTINQHIQLPTLTRYTNFLKTNDVVDYLLMLVQRLHSIATAAEQLHSCKAILDFFRDFSRKDNCVLTRSVLQVAFLPQNHVSDSVTSFTDLIKESVRDFVNPAAINPSFGASEIQDCKSMIDEFLDSCSKICYELLRVFGHNRARQRESYAVLLDELGIWHEEAERLDSILHNILVKQYEANGENATSLTVPVTHQHVARFGSFALYHILKCMIEYLTLGFELDLYATHEYAFIFWYLNEFLFKWTINVLHKVDSILYEQDQLNNAPSTSKSKVDKKKQKQQKKKHINKTSHRLEILHTQSYQKLCESYCRAMLAFHAAKRIPLPKLLNNEEYDSIRYERRFAPFFNVSKPPIISYQQYLEISNFKQIVEQVPPSRLFNDAAHSFDEARLCLETVPHSDEAEMSTLIKVCKQNSIVLKLLATGTQDKHEGWPKFEFSPHKVYPMIKLK